MTLFVVDIDGTIAHAGRRFERAGAEPSREDKAIYDSWVSQVQDANSLLEDEAVTGMDALCWALSRFSKGPLASFCYLTSREERWRDITEIWLKKRGFPDAASTPLYMRKNGDYTEGKDYKEREITTLKQAYGANSVLVIDDDEHGQIEEVCKRNNWGFLKARSGGQR